jgi:hypothetical protein
VEESAAVLDGLAGNRDAGLEIACSWLQAELTRRWRSISEIR